jgi:hypothetical protein
VVSPLTRFRVYEQDPTVDETLFEVEGLAPGQLLRLATLDTYDGVAYTVGSDEVTSESGSFDRVPSVFDQLGVSGRQTTLAVTVDGYSGVWLPTVGKFESIDFGGRRATATGWRRCCPTSPPRASWRASRPARPGSRRPVPSPTS